MVKRKHSKVRGTRSASKSTPKLSPKIFSIPLKKPILKAARVSTKHPKRIAQIIEQAKSMKRLSSPKNQVHQSQNKVPDPPLTEIEPSYENSIPKRAFQNLCKDVAQKFLVDCQFTEQALEALQWAAEDFMVGFFQDAGEVAKHAKRKILNIKDIELVKKLRKLNFEPL